MLDQYLIRPEEKDIADHRVVFLDAMKGLEVAKKYIHESDIKHNITVTCNIDEN